MRSLLLFPLSLLLLLVCSCDADKAAIAAKTAQQYYQYLLSGQYEAFVDGQYRSDSIPESYRNQLIDNIKMYVYQQQQRRKGIQEVQVVNVESDTLRHVTNVFLMLSFGDSTHEEVCVPMVEHDKIWYMK